MIWKFSFNGCFLLVESLILFWREKCFSTIFRMFRIFLGLVWNSNQEMVNSNQAQKSSEYKSFRSQVYLPHVISPPIGKINSVSAKSILFRSAILKN